MNQYMITFGIELTDEQLDIIEANCHIPAKIGTVYINAKSSGHAMRIFKKQYGIKKVLFRTSNLLKYVYVVRPITGDDYVLFRVAGLRWSEDYTTLI